MKQLVNGSKAKAEGLVARERSQEKGYGNSDRGILESKTRNNLASIVRKRMVIVISCGIRIGQL